MNIELKHLVLTQRLTVLDLESTGVDPATDRIIEVAALTLSPGSGAELFQSRVNPGRPIPMAATAIHGLGDADVRDAPTFGEIAANLARRLDGCDLAGFGITGFDLPLLCAEFVRVAIPFHVTGRAVVDALSVFRRHEPRTLSAAVELYLGRAHTGAHSAAADARAAIEVLDGQVDRYGLPTAPGALHALLVDVDVGGKFRRVDGRVVFAFGKYVGRALVDVARSDPAYLEWILSRPFLPDVHSLVRRALAG